MLAPSPVLAIDVIGEAGEASGETKLAVDVGAATTTGKGGKHAKAKAAKVPKVPLVGALSTGKGGKGEGAKGGTGRGGKGSKGGSSASPTNVEVGDTNVPPDDGANGDLTIVVLGKDDSEGIDAAPAKGGKAKKGSKKAKLGKESTPAPEAKEQDAERGNTELEGSGSESGNSAAGGDADGGTEYAELTKNANSFQGAIERKRTIGRTVTGVIAVLMMAVAVVTTRKIRRESKMKSQGYSFMIQDDGNGILKLNHLKYGSI